MWLGGFVGLDIFYGHYAYRPDAVLAACKQERHAVALVDFPAAFGNVEQPSFGN